MMNDRLRSRQPPSAGLCESCGHAERVISQRGSEFVLCGRSRQEPAYPKYPALPVLQCLGWERATVE